MLINCSTFVATVFFMKVKLFFPLLFLLCACEEVIQLELEPGQQRVVAEAILDVGQGVCTLVLSKSGDFYASNNFEQISGAQVSLCLPGGELRPLTDLGNGQYVADQLALFPGDTTMLRIALPDGQSTESSPVLMPAPVVLDSLIIEKNEATGGPGGGPNGGSEESYSLTVEWRDVPNMENYYRVKIFRNGLPETGLYLLADDRLGDGLKISRPVIRQNFEKGDLLHVQLLAVSKAYYDYFTDLANAEGRGLSAPAPYNPKGNFSNDMLGYFGAWYVSEKSVLVE